ncbi:hypothetical protein TWF730_002590 [Orbilia blumenaviensis]|uniref:Uncharacterized protein n=1 Tax=Orbilia blumenaviensis TaxID=1796055 RepID=A0AAV9UER7_9PEZI
MTSQSSTSYQQSQGSSAVKTGLWYDWDKGRIFGPTLTLKDQDAAVLLVVLTISVTLSANRSWHVWRSLWHAVIGRFDGPGETTRRQQQVILRNSETDGGALLNLIGSWFNDGFKKVFRGRTSGEYLLSGFCFFHLAAFIACGVLVSQVVGGKVVVSKTLPGCGQWYPNAAGYSTKEFLYALQEMRYNQTVDAETYVRSCYSEGGSQNVLACNKFISPALSYTTESNVACPFTVVKGTCLRDDNSAFALDSGNVTFSQLGINNEYGNQISINRQSTCAVIDAELFRVSLNPLLVKDDNVTRAQYSFATAFGQNLTSLFTNYKLDSTYVLEATNLIIENKTRSDIQRPLRPLTPMANDVSLILLHGYGVWFLEPSDDLFFSVHRDIVLNNSTGVIPPDFRRYGMDRFVNAIACIDRKRYCSSITGQCTSWTGLLTPGSSTLDGYLQPLLGPGITTNSSDAASNLVFSLLFVDLMAQQTSFVSSIQDRSAAAALQASKYIILGEQTRLQREQWKTELRYWFAIALARFQLETLNSIDIPPNVDVNRASNLWEEVDRRSLKALCGRVKFRDPNHTSMTLFGIAFILAGAGFLALVSLCAMILQNTPLMKYKHPRISDWYRDEVLALLEGTQDTPNIP